MIKDVTANNVGNLEFQETSRPSSSATETSQMPVSRPRAKRWRAWSTSALPFGAGRCPTSPSKCFPGYAQSMLFQPGSRLGAVTTASGVLQAW